MCFVHFLWSFKRQHFVVFDAKIFCTCKGEHVKTILREAFYVFYFLFQKFFMEMNICHFKKYFRQTFLGTFPRDFILKCNNGWDDLSLWPLSLGCFAIILLFCT